MIFVESYSLESEVEQLHCHIPGGQNFQDIKAQFGVGTGVDIDARVGQGLGEGQEVVIGVAIKVGLGLRVVVGVGVEVEQAVLIMTVTRRNTITSDFSMTTVVYDLLFGKVNYNHIDKNDALPCFLNRSVYRNYHVGSLDNRVDCLALG
jgi:hypothetical protein